MPYEVHTPRPYANGKASGIARCGTWLRSSVLASLEPVEVTCRACRESLIDSYRDRLKFHAGIGRAIVVGTAQSIQHASGRWRGLYVTSAICDDMQRHDIDSAGDHWLAHAVRDSINAGDF